MKKNIIYTAFPQHLNNKIKDLLKIYSLDSEINNHHNFAINLGDEQIKIPARIYLDENKFENIQNLPSIQQDILNCILTRHHNGFIRQKHLKNILGLNELRIAPYILALIGEYVIDILINIDENLSSNNVSLLKQIIKLNPAFWDTTKSRVISYWNEYYRKEFINKEDYIGFKIISKLV